MEPPKAPAAPPSPTAAAPTAPSDSPHTEPEQKRLKLSLKVNIETGADGKAPIHQVFPDGSYLPAIDSHFERTSAAATAFVARALAAPSSALGTASVETNAPDSHDPAASWTVKAVTAVEGAMYETQRALAVIEALRAETPVLELKRIVPRGARAADTSSDAADQEAEGMLMAKQRSMNKCADFLDERVKAMEKWVKADNGFCDAFLTIRKKCNGVRRMPNGTPLIDVGDGDFSPVLRPRERRIATAERDDGDADEAAPGQRLPWINFPAATYLKFGIGALDADVPACTAPIMLTPERIVDEQSMTSVVRRVRLSRVSAFRRKTFEHIAKEAAGLPLLTELTTNAVGLECGPKDLVRIERTQRGGSAPSLDAGTDPGSNTVEDMVALQSASLLQILATHSCLKQALNVERSKPTKILDRVLATTSSRSVVSATEKVLDDAVQMLWVRLEWTRGLARIEESRVRVFSTSADGDGPERALATIEPISTLSNGGNEGDSGHVRVTPAFGVIIAAPDDPSVRGRTVTPHSHSSSSGAATSAVGLDDVPRSYVCPVGGEILSVLTLLLCIRLLDALETEARSGEPEMLDVDRQCFTVIVSAPSTGHTLKAKVWPRGPGVGEEVPGSTVWLNGQKIENFPSVGPGRVASWKKLLQRLVAGDVEVKDGARDVNASAGDAQTAVEIDVQGASKDPPVSLSIDQVRSHGTAQGGAPVTGAPAQASEFPFPQPPTDQANQFQFDL